MHITNNFIFASFVINTECYESISAEAIWDDNDRLISTWADELYELKKKTLFAK